MVSILIFYIFKKTNYCSASDTMHFDPRIMNFNPWLNTFFSIFIFHLQKMGYICWMLGLHPKRIKSICFFCFNVYWMAVIKYDNAGHFYFLQQKIQDKPVTTLWNGFIWECGNRWIYVSHFKTFQSYTLWPLGEECILSFISVLCMPFMW